VVAPAASRGLSPLEPGADAIGDQASLELPDGGHHVGNQFARRGRGVHVLLDRDEVHPAAAQVLQGLDELLDGAGRPVEALDDDRIELPPGGGGQETPEADAISPCRRSHIGVGGNNHPPAPVGEVSDLFELDLEILLIGAHSSVGRNVHWAVIPAPAAPTGRAVLRRRNFCPSAGTSEARPSIARNALQAKESRSAGFLP